MNVIRTIDDTLQLLIQNIPPLTYVLKKLEKTQVRYGLYAGSHVAVMANNREPIDVDFLVHDDDLLHLKELFPFAKTKDKGNGVFLYIGSDDAIEFMSCATALTAGNYPFHLTDLAVEHLTTYQVGSLKINLVDPVDTLLLKAILQRGPEQGKHDLEDIEAVLAQIQINLPYLKQRLIEANAMERTKEVWRRFDIKV